ncbi:MAG: hypothetical protein ACRC4P_03095, partial [Aeromonas sp.]
METQAVSVLDSFFFFSFLNSFPGIREGRGSAYDSTATVLVVMKLLHFPNSLHCSQLRLLFSKVNVCQLL